MEVTAWNNGNHHKTGAGYGFKLKKEDRDKFFSEEWKNIYLSIPGRKDEIEINIAKASFWNQSCRELISKEIGKWLISNSLAPWPTGQPPKFVLECQVSNHFKLKLK